jgi:hypothetical protein
MSAGKKMLPAGQLASYRIPFSEREKATRAHWHLDACMRISSISVINLATPTAFN